MAEFKKSTQTYLKTIRKINPHFKEWTDSDIIDLCLTVEIDKRLGRDVF